jgi:hypothetical protein
LTTWVFHAAGVFEIWMIVALLRVRVCPHVYILTMCFLEQLPGWSAVYDLFHEDVSCPASWSPKPFDRRGP